MGKGLIITIDGPSGVGKTTVAKELAKILDFKYIDTGAMYRALALAVKRDLVTSDKALTKLAYSLPSRVDFKDDLVYLDNEDVTGTIRTEEIGMMASLISQRLEVREALWQWQRALAQGKAIFEGRDMGTVVFPDAFIKFYLTATAKVRAERRLRQLKEMGRNIDFDEIYQKILRRDEQDKMRPLAPLKPAPDAIIIDTTCIEADKVVDKMLDYILSRMQEVNLYE